MTLDWHNATTAEENGTGYDILLDITPEYTTDQAAEYKPGVLVRTSKPAWIWVVRAQKKDEKGKNTGWWFDVGAADTKEQAITDGLAAVDRRQGEQ